MSLVFSYMTTRAKNLENCRKNRKKCQESSNITRATPLQNWYDACGSVTIENRGRCSGGFGAQNALGDLDKSLQKA